MRIALIVFILFPIIEMMLLIEVGSQIGTLTTIVLVFLTAILGVNLIRKQGAQTMLRAQNKIRQGALPANEMLEGLMLGFAGVCLLVPGFVSDAIGGLLLLPMFRKSIAAIFLVKFISSRVNMHAAWNRNGPAFNQEGETFEGEFTSEDKDLLDKK